MNRIIGSSNIFFCNQERKNDDEVIYIVRDFLSFFVLFYEKVRLYRIEDLLRTSTFSFCNSYHSCIGKAITSSNLFRILLIKIGINYY